jgi:hypothetical protein
LDSMAFAAGRFAFSFTIHVSWVGRRSLLNRIEVRRTTS